MAVKLRLQRGGAKRKPIYRLVAADVRMKRDGRFLENLGQYDPASKKVSLSKERIQHWLDNGAGTSETVNRILIKEGFSLAVGYDQKAAQAKAEAKAAAAKAKAAEAKAEEA